MSAPLSKPDRDAVAAIKTRVDDQGPDWTCEARRCRATLTDLLPGQALLINILVDAVECGVTRDLRAILQGTASLSRAAPCPRWIRCLRESHGRGEADACRALGIWAAVFAVELPTNFCRTTQPPPAPVVGRWLAVAGVAVALAVAAGLAMTDVGKGARDWVASLARNRVVPPPPDPPVPALPVPPALPTPPVPSTATVPPASSVPSVPPATTAPLAPPDRVNVALPSSLMTLLLVAAGRREIPDEDLRAWPQYEKEYRRPRELVVTSPFYMGDGEVTLAEFMDVLGRPPGAEDAAGAVLPPPDAPAWQRPATGVPWIDAIRFCNALSEREGLRPCYRVETAAGAAGETKVTRDGIADGFRLPTPDEWVYACLTNDKLRGMTEGVMEWSDLEPAAVSPFKHGGWDGGPKQGPTFLLRGSTTRDCGFRIVRDAAPGSPDTARP